MPTGIRHLWPEYSDGTVHRGEGFIKSCHLAANGRFPFDQDDLVAVIGKIERRLDSSDASPYDESPPAERYFSALEWLEPEGPRHCHSHQIDGFACSGFGFVNVNPTALFPQVSHFEQVRIEAGAFEHLPEGGFMEPWRAGGDHHAVKPELGNIFPDALLTGFRARIVDISRNNDIFKFGALGGDPLAIDCSGDVQSAMADKDADSRILVMYGGFLHVKVSGSPKIIPLG
jgi:hypothetical protein